MPVKWGQISLESLREGLRSTASRNAGEAAVNLRGVFSEANTCNLADLKVRSVPMADDQLALSDVHGSILVMIYRINSQSTFACVKAKRARN